MGKHVLKRCAASSLLASLALALGSCALFGGGHADTDDAEIAAEADAGDLEGSAPDHEARLRAMVRKRIESGGDAALERRDKLVHRQPYWYKQYDAFPEGPDAFQVLMQQTESRAAPYIADVALPKTRY